MVDKGDFFSPPPCPFFIHCSQCKAHPSRNTLIPVEKMSNSIVKIPLPTLRMLIPGRFVSLPGLKMPVPGLKMPVPTLKTSIPGKNRANFAGVLTFRGWVSAFFDRFPIPGDRVLVLRDWVLVAGDWVLVSRDWVLVSSDRVSVKKAG